MFTVYICCMNRQHPYHILQISKDDINMYNPIEFSHAHPCSITLMGHDGLNVTQELVVDEDGQMGCS